MTMQDVRLKVESMIRTAGAELQNVANQAIGVGTWSKAVFDCRFGTEHATSISKASVLFLDGTRKSLRGTADSVFAISEAHDLVRTDESLKDIRWYGIILTALPDGSCSWELLTDPNCVNAFSKKW